MSTSLTTQLADAIKTAMRARDTERLSTLRFLQASIKQKEVDERRELSHEEVLAIIERQVKQRRESALAFEEAGRIETANKEKAEIVVLQEFLPQAADATEVAAVIDQAIADVTAQGITGGAAMGRVMGTVKKALAGRADMSQVSALVKQKLG